MKRYTVRNNGTCLYICVMPSHIYVERFRMTSVGDNSDSLSRTASWYINPPSPSLPSMTKMDLVRMIQELSEDVYTEIIKTIIHHKPVEQKGDAPSTNSSCLNQGNPPS